MPSRMTRRGNVPTRENAGPLIIATDAAVDLAQARYGTAHLGTDGSWGLTLRTFDETEGEDPVVVCELRAVFYALQHVKWEGGAAILTDSRAAEGWLHLWQLGGQGYPAGYNHQQRWPAVSHLARLRELVAANPQLKFHWVHGHDGHPLNEFADSGAKLALRIGTGSSAASSSRDLPPQWAATRLEDWFRYGATVG